MILICIDIVFGQQPQRGVCLAFWDCQDGVTINATWMYNYQTSPPNNCAWNWYNVKFLPMIKTMNDLSAIDSLKNNVNVEHVLTFNEPDVNGISPEDALNAWPKIMELGAYGKKIGSPGTFIQPILIYFVYVYSVTLLY